MSTVLLDTNIVSYLFQGDTRAADYAPHLLNQELALSLMTVTELFNEQECAIGEVRECSSWKRC